MGFDTLNLSYAPKCPQFGASNAAQWAITVKASNGRAACFLYHIAEIFESAQEYPEGMKRKFNGCGQTGLGNFKSRLRHFLHGLQGVASMAKIVRTPNGPMLRDDKGEHTGIAFVTNGAEVVWISNK